MGGKRVIYPLSRSDTLASYPSVVKTTFGTVGESSAVTEIIILNQRIDIYLCQIVLHGSVLLTFHGSVIACLSL